MAVEPQEMRPVAQLLEAKLGGVANPLLWAAEAPQLWVGSSTQLPWDAPAQHAPPNLPAGHMLIAQHPLLPPPRWLHLFLGGLPLPPTLLPRASKPALHLSQLGWLLHLYSGCITPGP